MTGRNNFLSVRHNEGFWPERLTTLEKIYLSRWDPFWADFAGKPDMPRKAPRKAAGTKGSPIDGYNAKITPRQIGVHPDAHVINMVSSGTFCGIPRGADLRWGR